MNKNTLLIIFIFTFFTAGLGQKNRFQRFFIEIDSIKDKEVQLEKLQSFPRDKRLNDNELKEFYKRIIPTAIETQKYVVALKHAFDAEKLAKKLKNDTLLCYYINQIGGTYYYIGDKKKAIYFFKKSYKIAEKGNFWKTAAMTSSNIGAISIEARDFSNAEYYLENAIEIFKRHHIDQKEGLLSYRLLATLYTDNKQFNKAKPIFEEIIQIAKKIKDSTMISSSLIYYANFLSNQGNNPAAIKLLNESLKLQRLLNDKPTLISNISILAHILYKNKEFQKAFDFQKEAFDLNKQIFQSDLKNGIAETEVKYKTAEIKRQKELAESKTLAEKRKRNLYVFLFLGVIFLLVITFLLVYVSQQNKRRKSEIQLQRELIESVVKAQEEEKVRMARDLHDGICQKFAATKMKFSTISSDLEHKFPELDVKYKSALSLLDEATNELRGISHEIMPPALDKKDLISALKQLSQQTFSEQISYTFEVFGKPIELSENEQINIYRIAQELFANVMKHAFASEVSVQLLFTDANFTLIVEDNGVGIDVEKSDGIGLKNLRLRAEIIQAKLTIEKGHEKGTFSSLTLTK